MSGIPSDQVLAILRIRQWAQDRAAMKTAKVTDLQRQGWQTRRRRTADARIVRVIDFERAFSRLTQDEQLTLAAIYRDNLSHTDTARLVGFSLRKLDYFLPTARARLTEILDRLDLL